MFFLDHIWLIPLFPAFGAACMFFFGRKLSKSTVSGICVGMVVLAFVWACLAVWQYTDYSAAHPGKPFEKVLYTWLGTGDGSLTYPMHGGKAAEFRADAGFLLDPLSAIWLLFVTGVGMLIHIYSIGYMAHEGGYYRFFGYLNLFMFSMLTLILANNYALMFVGWEGVGLCSYLLIGFYFLRHSASTAANKAFIVNRIGDAGFILGMFTIAWYFGSLQYTAVNHLARSGAVPHRRSGNHRPRACCCSWVRAASRRSFRCTSGCRTRWKVRRRSPRSSTPQPWSPQAFTWWRAPTRCSCWRPMR